MGNLSRKRLSACEVLRRRTVAEALWRAGGCAAQDDPLFRSGIVFDPRSQVAEKNESVLAVALPQRFALCAAATLAKQSFGTSAEPPQPYRVRPQRNRTKWKRNLAVRHS